MKNQNLQQSALAALDSQNAKYCARHPEFAGYQKDLQNARKWAIAFAGSFATLERVGMSANDACKLIADTGNVKIAATVPQLLNFLATGNTGNFHSAIKTTILTVCGILANAKTREGLTFAVTGKGNEHTSSEITIHRARKFLTAFGAIGQTSAPSQMSVALGKSGVLFGLGVTDKPMPKGALEMPCLTDAPITRAIVAFIATATDTTIDALVAAQKGKK